MKITTKIKVNRGNDKFLNGKWKEEAVKVLDKHAFAIEAGAKVNAPLLTGALKNGIHVEFPRQTLRTISDKVNYGVYQELGTSRGVKAKFFLTRACEKQAQPFFTELQAIFA